MSMDIIYQNVRSLRNKTTEFFNMLSNADADIISVTETWLNDDCENSELSSINYQIFRRDRNYTLSHTIRGGGVLTAIRSDILAFRLESAETSLKFIEDIWIKIILPDTTLYVCTVYISPHADPRQYNAFFDQIKENITNFGSSSKIMILGDFNLPNINWYDSNNNSVEPYLLSRSETYEHFVDMLDLCSLHQFNQVRNSNNAILDLVLSNTEFDGTVVERTSDSIINKEDIHHPTLYINIKTKISYLKCKNHRKLNYRRADYIKINDELSHTNWDFINEMSVNDSVDRFYAILFNSINKHTPKFYTKKKNPFWFTPEINRILRKKEYFRLKWKSTQNHIYYSEFSKLRQKAKQMISISFETHMNHIQTTMPNNVKIFWAYTKSKRKSNTYPNELSYNNVSSSNPITICNMFGDFFKSTYSADNSTQSNSNENNNSNNNAITLTLNNVLNTLNAIDPNKNGGPDGIPNIFLINTAQSISYPLYLIFKNHSKREVFQINLKRQMLHRFSKKG